MKLRKQEFIDWKNSLVTLEMIKDITEAAEVSAAELVNKRESNPYDDQYLRGYIRGVQASLEWEPEFSDEGEENA